MTQMFYFFEKFIVKFLNLRFSWKANYSGENYCSNYLQAANKFIFKFRIFIVYFIIIYFIKTTINKNDQNKDN